MDDTQLQTNATLRRIRSAPEHMALMDLAESLRARLESPGVEIELNEHGTLLAYLETFIKRLDHPPLDRHGRPSFLEEYRGLESLHRLAVELLHLHYTHAAFKAISPDAEWLALQVEDQLADYSPALHHATWQHIDTCNKTPAPLMRDRLMQRYVFSQYDTNKEVPGAPLDKLASCRAQLAYVTGGEAIPAASHWEHFDPRMVQYVTHSTSETQKEQSYFYGDPGVPGDQVCLGRFQASVEHSPIHGGYRTTPGGREIIKQVHRMFHEGHAGIGLPPLIRTTMERFAGELKAGFEKALQMPEFKKDRRVLSLAVRYGSLVESPPRSQAIERGYAQ